MLSCLLFLRGMAQNEPVGSKGRLGIFTEFVATWQLAEVELFSSLLRPGAGIGIQYATDMGARNRVSLGAGLYGYSIVTRDYALMYPDDWDPVKAEVDVYKSFVENETHFLQVVIPLQFRIWLGKENHRWYMTPGIEGRIHLDDETTATIHESGVSVNEVPHETLFRVRKGGVAASVVVGRSLPWMGHTLHLGILGRYSLTRPFDFDEGGLFANTAKGRPLDLGVRVGLEL